MIPVGRELRPAGCVEAGNCTYSSSRIGNSDGGTYRSSSVVGVSPGPGPEPEPNRCGTARKSSTSIIPYDASFRVSTPLAELNVLVVLVVEPSGIFWMISPVLAFFVTLRQPSMPATHMSSCKKVEGVPTVSAGSVKS